MSENFDFLKAIEDVRKDFEKKLAEFTQQQRTSVEDFQKILDESLKAAKTKIELDTSQIITTKSITDGTVWYRTTISALGSIIDEYPSQQPKTEDVYWERHKKQVDNALTMRKDLLLEIIKTIGTAVGGILNPGGSAGKSSDNEETQD